MSINPFGRNELSRPTDYLGQRSFDRLNQAKTFLRVPMARPRRLMGNVVPKLHGPPLGGPCNQPPLLRMCNAASAPVASLPPPLPRVGDGARVRASSPPSAVTGLALSHEWRLCPSRYGGWVDSSSAGSGGRREGMRDGLLPAQGGSPNFGDSQAMVTLGAVSGAARRSPQRGVSGPPGRTCGGGDGGGGGRWRGLAFLPLSGALPTGGESLPQRSNSGSPACERVTRPSGRGARPGAGPDAPGGADGGAQRPGAGAGLGGESSQVHWFPRRAQ